MDTKAETLNYATPVAIVLAGLIIGVAVIYGNYQGKTPMPGLDDTDAVAALENLDPISEKDHVRGSATAAIKVIEYSDLECPFCKVFHQSMIELVAENKEVAWVFRHFPIDTLHPKARHEAVAAECAASIAGKDTFWKYIDRVFVITPSNNGLDAAELPKIAAELGVDPDGFRDCLESERTAAIVNTNHESGVSIGVDGTPYVVIIGRDGTAYPVFKMNLATIKDKEVKALAEEIFRLYDKNIRAAQSA